MIKDLTFQRFGRLIAVHISEPAKNRQSKWLCRCDCGKMNIIRTTRLVNGMTKSCGCLAAETTAKRNYKHGLSDHKLYLVWAEIKSRCTNKKHSKYPAYGGRGILLCKEWIDDPESFIRWSINNGWKPGLEIDREDNDGIYEPNNCRFVIRAVNICNTQLLRTDNSSGFRGVYFDKTFKSWKAQVQRKSIGRFRTALLAALYRDCYVLAHGNFLPLNFPQIQNIIK